MDPRTNGAVVYENMETSVPGIFACGNVVHVHDLVDYVSAESERAGAAAAAYVLGGASDAAAVDIVNGDDVGYTVPQKLRVDNVAKVADVFFRVMRVFKDSVIEVKAGDRMLVSYKREHMAPGEMEHILLPKKLLEGIDTDAITIAAKEA